MTLSYTRWRISQPNVVHETLDGEVVAINLDTGSYYSLERVGAEVWAMIEKGDATTDEVVSGIARRYGGEGVQPAVVGLLDELRREGLVAAYESAERGTSSPLKKYDAGTGGPPFEAPVLRKYTDMQDLILLDPIHEVDETGWPNREPEPAKPE